MTRLEPLHEGKTKIVYATDDPDVYIQDFKDSDISFDGAEKGTVVVESRTNNAVSSRLFELLEGAGVRTHFLGLESPTAMRIRRLDMLKLEFVVRNVAAGSLAARIGYPEGTALKDPPLIEYYSKDDALHDALLCVAHMREMEVVTFDELSQATRAAQKVNEELQKFFAARGLILVDFKLEFGRDDKGSIVLADEISPDTCRLWDAETGEKLDKDRSRRILAEEEVDDG
jgi:phosphoribosylaminoimidazole-succinocarboxamide synthase